MTGAAPITIACLDLAGTTVADGDTVETAFAESISTLGLAWGTSAHADAMARVRAGRGRAKRAVVREIFADEARVQVAEPAFERSYDQLIDRRGLAPVPGAEEALDRLADAGVRVCLLTGFNRRTLGRVLDCRASPTSPT